VNVTTKIGRARAVVVIPARERDEQGRFESERGGSPSGGGSSERSRGGSSGGSQKKK
jgi:hypothetical protein